MRFPNRTLVLMILAMLAFVWMYWQTHRSAPQTTQTLQAHPVVNSYVSDAGRIFEAVEISP